MIETEPPGLRHQHTQLRRRRRPVGALPGGSGLRRHPTVYRSPRLRRWLAPKTAAHEVARGGVASCGIAPADVFRYPIAAGSKSLILAHNHPSGDPTPSEDDKLITRRLQDCGKLLGLQVLDHVVAGEGRAFSFLDEGLLR